MSLPFAESVVLTAYKSQGRDEYNKPVTSYYPPKTINGVGITTTDTVDVKNGTVQRADVDYRLYMPAGVKLDSRDKLTVRGHPCTINGIAEPERNMFTGTTYRTEVKVKRTDG